MVALPQIILCHTESKLYTCMTNVFFHCYTKLKKKPIHQKYKPRLEKLFTSLLIMQFNVQRNAVVLISALSMYWWTLLCQLHVPLLPSATDMMRMLVIYHQINLWLACCVEFNKKNQWNKMLLIYLFCNSWGPTNRRHH